jgi:hypothetical protein
VKDAESKMNDSSIPIPNLFESLPDKNSDPYYGAVRDQKERIHIKNHIDSMWDKFYRCDLQDSHFISEFPRKDKFWQRLWELEVANFLLANGFELNSADIGVDFICKKDSKEFYVECVACDRGLVGSPDYCGEIFPSGEEVVSLAIDDMPERERGSLLRLTNSIDKKVNKYHKDVEKGVIRGDIPYIIALSTALLPNFIGDEDDMPLAVKAVYPVGNICFRIGVPTGTTGKSGRAWRESIIKKSDTSIRTDIFLPTPENEKYKSLAGILYSGSDFRVNSSARIQQNGHSFIFVHNIAAVKPVDLGFLGSKMDFWVEQIDDDYVVKNNAN